MVDKEPSGRELECEVAKRVFGFRWFHCAGANGVERDQFMSPETAETWRRLNWTLAEVDGPQDDQFNDDTAAPKYSKSIEAAMQVVEKMREQGWSFACTWYEGKLPYASFCKGTAKSSRNAEANSLPEAICRAALAAINSGAPNGN